MCCFNMIGYSKTRTITLAFIMTFIMLEDVDAVAQGRRRRRNLRNMMSCTQGERAVWNTYKKVTGCVPCPSNTYRPDKVHYMETCTLCPAGRHPNPEHTLCIGDICAAGKFGVAGTVVCTDCVAGKYSQSGSFSCTDCESGRFTSNTGNGACTGDMCPAGKFGMVGQTKSEHTICRTCEMGKWSSAGAKVCASCPVGKYSGVGSSRCDEHETCARNSYYKYKPTSTSKKIVCERCIYMNDRVTVAYYLAVVVASLNALLMLCKFKTYCFVFLFVVCAGGWASWLNFCADRVRGYTSVIVSIVMNIMCSVCICKVTVKYCKSLFSKYVGQFKFPCGNILGGNNNDMK